MSEVLIWMSLALLLLVNAFGVFLVLLQMPGTWGILLATGLAAWWQSERIGWVAIVILVALAIIGEIIEFIGSAHGSRTAGGTRRAAILSLLFGTFGAIVGAILGSFIPIIGTLAGILIGACLSAGLGSYLGDRWAGRSHQQASQSGQGAAVGRLWGTVGKVVVAVVMWLVTAVAVFL